jgi:hypothetical protein
MSSPASYCSIAEASRAGERAANAIDARVP